MDFTVLRRTLEGCSSLYACHVEETEKQTGKDKDGDRRGEQEKDSEERNCNKT